MAVVSGGGAPAIAELRRILRMQTTYAILAAKKTIYSELNEVLNRNGIR